MPKTAALQDIFLNQVRKDKILVTVYLTNGIKLQGLVVWFDNFTLLLKRDGIAQLVFKHAVSTILPAEPIHIHVDQDEVSE